jgi:hypothetical protein
MLAMILQGGGLLAVGVWAIVSWYREFKKLSGLGITYSIIGGLELLLVCLLIYHR